MVQKTEHHYINDYMQQFHPTNLQWRNVRLGPLPNVPLAKLYTITLRFVDAIYVDKDGVHLVEAKLVNQLSGIAQLELYKKLFLDTPEFSEYHNKPIFLHLVVPRAEPEVQRMCQERGIAYEVYKPSWYEGIRY